MSDDLKQSLTPVVDMAVGLFNALLATATFIGVLALVGRDVQIPLASGTITLPFGFVIAAIAYAAIMSMLTWTVGKPLIAAVERQNAAEAELRFELTRVRESAESIALVKGEEEEKRRLAASLDRLAKAIWAIGHNHGRITILTNINVILLPVIPFLIGAPKYMAGGMSLRRAHAGLGRLRAGADGLQLGDGQFHRAGDLEGGGQPARCADRRHGRAEQDHRRRRRIADRHHRGRWRRAAADRSQGAARRRDGGDRPGGWRRPPRRARDGRRQIRHREKHADPRHRRALALGHGRDRDARPLAHDVPAADALSAAGHAQGLSQLSPAAGGSFR